MRKNTKQDRAFSGEENSNQDVTAKATFKIPAEINPRFTDTSTTTTDVTASISINYDRQGDKIRVNKVYGSWKPATSMIEISKREVHYGDGVPLGGKSDHKYPTSNSFHIQQDGDGLIGILLHLMPCPVQEHFHQQ